jgi:hypothetical protein
LGPNTEATSSIQALSLRIAGLATSNFPSIADRLAEAVLRVLRRDAPHKAPRESEKVSTILADISMRIS